MPDPIRPKLLRCCFRDGTARFRVDANVIRVPLVQHPEMVTLQDTASSIVTGRVGVQGC